MSFFFTNVWKRVFLFVKFLIAAGFIFTNSAAHALPNGFVKNTVVSNLQAPVNVVTLPDGRLLIAEKAGVVKIFDPANPQGSVRTVLTLQSVESGRERGLASIALAPDFASSGFLYLYYTRITNDVRNRISRFRFVNDNINRGSEVLVWEDNSPYMSCCHFGGGLDFGPDGMLYLTTGEEFSGPQAQDLTEAGGKIIRLNVANVTPSTPWVRNATNTHIIPADNPSSIMDGPGGNLDEIWAYGLRNPFRAHWDIQGNRFFIGDVGGNIQATAFEEVNLGVIGADYGWPLCEGSCSISGVENPVYSYGHQVATPAGGAVAAGPVYRGTQFPIQYQNRFFFSDYAQGYVSYLHLNSNNQLTSVTRFDSNVGAPVAIEVGLDGTLYVVDYIGGRLLEYRYAPDNQPPTINFALASTLSGPSPLAVSFSASATDPDGDPLTYSWSFGDGTPNRFGRNITTTYVGDGVYFARLRVSDGTSDTLSDVIEIQVGTAPVASIDFPADGTTFAAGDTITFAGSVLNQVANANYDFDWNIDFLHNAHRHPTLQLSAVGGEYDVPTTGHDYLGDTGYELSLTVTGPSGLTDTEVVTVLPRKVDLNLNSIPSGIPLFLDGIQLATPVVYDNIVGFEHVVAAPDSSCVNGTLYEFQNWNDGGQRIHNVVLPSNDLALNAQFVPAGDCSALLDQGLVAWYETDTGLQTNGAAEVTRWLDQSGRGNNWNIVRGSPVEVGNVLNGRSVISFDGIQDALVRTDALNGFPAGNADRTVFFLASYSSAGSGGFGYGTSALNRAFGLSVSSTGNYRVNGYGGRNDFVSSIAAVNGGWAIHDAVVNNNQVTQSINGQFATFNNHAYNTTGNRMVLGADLDEFPHVDMQIASLLVYNRALNEEELQSVRTYLQEKYLPGIPTTNQPPVARNDSLTVQFGSNASLNVLTNDSDPEGELSAQSLGIVRYPAYGNLQIAANGLMTYTHDGSISESDSFEYTVADTSGLVSNIASVTITIQEDDPADPPALMLVDAGLVAHYDADLGAVRSAGGVLNRWLDQSGLANDLNIVRGNPQVVESAINGYSAIDFDGAGDALTRDATLSGFASGGSDRSMYVIVNYRGPGYGGVTYGSAEVGETFGLGVNPTGNLMVQGWGPSIDQITNVNGISLDWMIQSVILKSGTMSHYLDNGLIDIEQMDLDTNIGSFVVGAELDYDPYIDVQIAQILIYDRALTPQEHAQNIGFLTYKYFGEGANDPPDGTNRAPVATNDIATVDVGGETIIDVLENDFDIDGLINAATVNIQRDTEFGDVLENTDGSITYQNLSTDQTRDSFSYTVADDQGLVSNPAEVTINIDFNGEPPIPPGVTFPLNGLVLHLEADQGVVVENQVVTAWNDISVNQNNLESGVSGPTLSNLPNNRPYISFDGVDDALLRDQNIVGLPSGNAERTMYTVVDYQSNGYGGITYGAAEMNQTYGHIVDPRGNLMLQAWGVSNDIRLPVNARNLGWAVHGSSLSAGEVVHYLDGQIIGSDVHDYDTNIESIAMGAEIDGFPFVKANIAAVFVYNRSLSELEHSNLYQYLFEKYIQ